MDQSRVGRIVIADDDDAVRSSLADLFDSSGRWEVLAAVSSGDELLSAVADHDPDLVVTDLHMPGGEDQLIEHLGRSPDRPAIIALTASTGPSAARRLVHLGADLVLRKGIDQVLAEAERLLAERGVRHRV